MTINGLLHRNLLAAGANRLAGRWLPARFGSPQRIIRDEADAKAPKVVARTAARRKPWRSFWPEPGGRSKLCLHSQNAGRRMTGRMGLWRVKPGREAWRDRGGSQGHPQLGRTPRKRLEGSGGVRVCQQWHDAKTASEHLAPRPFSLPTDVKRGRRAISLRPRRQRQLMHYRVCKHPVMRRLYPYPGAFNNILWE